MRRLIVAITTFSAVAIASDGCQQAQHDVPQRSGKTMARFKNPTELDIPELTRFFHSDDKGAREEAVLALGTIGSGNCIDPIVAALGDDDGSIRTYAMMGIERGIIAERAAREFLEAVFPALVPLLNRDDPSVFGKAPLLLLAIDSNRAIPILLSTAYFSTKNREIHYILRALNRNDVNIPHDKLLPLLAELGPIADKYPHDYAYSEALIAYGRNPDADTEEWLRKELSSTNEKIREGASVGLAATFGILNPYHHVCEVINRHGFETLSDPQKHYFAVSEYRGEVNNGGHSQYFFNSSGDSWKSALAGLKAIGAFKRVEILAEAAARFGSDGPSQDRMRRIEQLQRLPVERTKAFQELNARFYEASEDIDVLLQLYAIDNKSHFTPQSTTN